MTFFTIENIVILLIFSERVLPRHALPKDDAVAVDVTPLIELFTLRVDYLKKVKGKRME